MASGPSEADVRHELGELRRRLWLSDALFDDAPVALAVLDDEGRYVRVNGAFGALFGEAPELLVGRGVGEGAPGTEVWGEWRQVLAEGGASGAVRFKAPGAAGRWLEYSGVAGVVPDRHLLMVRDLTGQRRAEEARVGSERQSTFLRDLALSLAEAPDFGSAIRLMLQHVCTFTGFEIAELWIPELGGGHLERAGVWGAAGFEAYQAAAATVVAERSEGLLGRAWDGASPEIVDAVSDAALGRGGLARQLGLRSAVAVPILSGAVVAGVLVVVGSKVVTESWDAFGLLTAAAAQMGVAFQRKRADEAALRESAIVQEARVAIIGKTLDGTITSWNRGARDLYGYEAQEVIGRSVSILALPERPDEIPGILERLSRGEVVDSFSTERVRKDGRRVLIDLTVSPVRDALGRIVGASAIARDITRRHHLEEELRQAQKMESLGRLAGGIAHDFNNLLTVILGEVHTALAATGDEALTDNLEAVRQAAERAAALTRQLLSFARRQVPQARVLDLNEAIAGVSGLLRRVLGENVELVLLAQNDLWPVHVDPGHVQQVLMNLAVNAQEAMPAGGRLSIQTENVSLGEAYTDAHVTVAAGDYVRVSVTDTGSGMSPDVLDRVFEPFFTTKGDRGGTGLGLSTCYGIVQQAGGHIWAYSEEGQGTTFKIYLPRAAGTVEPRSEQQPDAHGGNETILFVEDESAVRAVGVRTLRRFGYRVLEASNGEEALQLARAHPGPIDLLITDVGMPVMGGRELAERLTRQRPEARVLFVSGYTEDEMLRRGFASGAVAFFAKPFVPRDLARRVRTV
ncbi:MAG TPA: PAS domain S-box protein, partial [Longimicrobiales bacterium]|nr:PAS domain S-box protein [Longimicrobiales bacterium]